jgi:exodeoxyribonuclease VII small subunit
VTEAETPKSFERALARLEEIASKLERGEATLEEGLALFEEGVALTRRCQELLVDAEQRIERLTATATGFTIAPFAAWAKRRSLERGHAGRGAGQVSGGRG